MNAGISAKGVWRQNRNIVERVLLVLSGLLLTFLGFKLWLFSVSVPGANLFAVIVVGGGLFMGAFSFYVSTPKAYNRLETCLFLLMIVGFVAWAYCSIYATSYYGTDELAFDQWSAELLVKGINPYGVDLSPSLVAYHVPVIFKTYTLSGAVVNILSYPALSFLIYTPFILLGFHTQLAVYVDIAFWAVTLFVLHLLIPRPYKSLSIILGLMPIYLGYVVGGVTDALFLPFLLLAAYQWDNFSDKRAGIARWVGPVGLGLAACIKQTAWFIAPFILVGIYRETRSIRVLLKYCLIGFVTFLIPNLPFIATKPVAWVKGIFAPFISSTIPSGQGLINLTMIERMGGGRLSLYTLSALLLLVTCLLVVWLYYPRSKKLIFILPSIVLFFPTRSFATYLVSLFPVFLLSALTVRDVEHDKLRISRKARSILVAVPFSLFVCVTTIALILPSPLKITVLDVHTTGQLRTVDAIRVEVQNRYSRPITPHFTMTMAPQLTSFWIVEQGPAKLEPGQIADYQLAAPNVSSMPNIDGGFVVDAFTNQPPSLSTARLYQPKQMQTFITPPSIDDIVPMNKPIHLTVQLYDHLGRRMQRAGIPVYLGQVVYDQNTLEAGESSINGNPEGKSPVVAFTNQIGEADFTIVDKQLQGKPIYYQAFIQPSGQFPFGYSQVVDIRFGEKAQK